MKAQSRPTLVVQEPLPNKTIWSFQGLRDKNAGQISLNSGKNTVHVAFMVK